MPAGIDTEFYLLTMFVGPVEKDVRPALERAERIYGQYGIRLVVWPYKERPVAAPYQELLDMKGSLLYAPETFAAIRGWARACYPVQVSFMCPVVFCRIGRKDVGGSTKNFGLPAGDGRHPRSVVLLDPVHADDHLPALAHEIGHAAGLSGSGLQKGGEGGVSEAYRQPNDGHSEAWNNLMFKSNEDGQGRRAERDAVPVLSPRQVALIKPCWFARPARH
jgi:hypothetical protein